MKTITEEGYGVSFKNIDITNKNALKIFVKDYCSATMNELIEDYTEDNFNVNDFCEDVANFGFDYSGCGIAEILANAIENTFRIPLYCAKDDEGIEYCLLVPSYPWQSKYNREVVYNELSEEYMNSVFKSMINAMLDYTPEGNYIDYQCVSNCV